MRDEKLIEGLLPINCFYNYEEWPDGKCYSTECMMNQDALLRVKIYFNGCRVFGNHPEVKRMIKEADNDG